ncbi:MAG: response regulator transcription factor [Betaproteobacteria bacterium]
MKILVVDDHALVREGLAQVLAGIYPQLTLLHAATGADAIALLLPHRNIDLVLLDYHLTDMTGLEVLRQLGKIQPSLVVLMISGSTTVQIIQQALNAGAAGFVTKSGDTQELLSAIEQVLQGEIYIPQELRAVHGSGKSGVSGAAPSLSRRQEQVLRGIMNGQSNREIAAELDLSEETVKTHVSAILRYFSVENRTQAAVAAADYAYSSSAPS